MHLSIGSADGHALVTVGWMCGEDIGELALEARLLMGEMGAGGEHEVKKLSGSLWVNMGLGVVAGVIVMGSIWAAVSLLDQKVSNPCMDLLAFFLSSVSTSSKVTSESVDFLLSVCVFFNEQRHTGGDEGDDIYCSKCCWSLLLSNVAEEDVDVVVVMGYLGNEESTNCMNSVHISLMDKRKREMKKEDSGLVSYINLQQFKNKMPCLLHRFHLPVLDKVSYKITVRVIYCYGTFLSRCHLAVSFSGPLPYVILNSIHSIFRVGWSYSILVYCFHYLYICMSFDQFFPLA